MRCTSTGFVHRHGGETRRSVGCFPGGAGTKPKAHDGPWRSAAMVAIGYTIMGEQAGPEQLVRDGARAEQVGFDFVAASDHFSPWLEEQGHAPYTWSVLCAVAPATETIEL